MHWLHEPLREPQPGRVYSPINYTDTMFKIINIVEDIWHNTDGNARLTEAMWRFSFKDFCVCGQSYISHSFF